METAPHPLRKPFRKRRLLWAVLPALPLLWGGWRVAVSRMDFPRLIICQPLPSLKPPLESDGSPMVGAVAVSPDGQTVWSGGRLAMVRSGGKTFLSRAALPICAWDGRTGMLRYTLPGHLRTVDALACSPDGKKLASSGWDNTVKVWDTDTRRLLWSRPGSTFGLVFSPDGRFLASGGALWDAATGRPLRLLGLPNEHLAGAAFSPDGRTLARVSDDFKIVHSGWPPSPGDPGKIVGSRAQLWDIASGRLKRTLPDDEADAFAFSPDGRWIACANNMGDYPGMSSGSVVHMVACATGAEKWHLESQGAGAWSVLRLAYSPNGKWLAAALVGHDVVLLDAATGRQFKRLRAYELPHGGTSCGSNSALAFSQDGKTLVGRGDNTVQVWDTRSLL